MPARKKKHPPRTIHLERAPTADGAGVFRFEERGRSTSYAIHEIPCEIGGRGFAIHRLGLATLYHVRIADAEADCSCECLGFLRHGRCKHVVGLRTLLADQQL
jgi:hypothetical protein